MATQTPNQPATPKFDCETPKFDWEIDAGVIEDARRRQQRQRGIGAALFAAAALAGLALGLVFGSGGAGAGAAPRNHGHGSSAGAAAHASPQVVVTSTHVPPSIFTFGLLAPDVGWVSNGIGFYLTRDGGRSWGALSLDTHHGNRYGYFAVPGFGMSGDIGPNITASASPNPATLALAFDDGRAYRTCHTTPAVGGGALTITADGGRTWRTQIMPGCVTPISLSFVSATIGFAAAGRSPALYETTDGAGSWHRVARLPAVDIDFTSTSNGWALGNNGKGLYHTTDGGRIWQRAGICGHGSVSCGAPHFFGNDGVINAWRITGTTDRVHPLVYTTSDGGRSWVPFDVPVSATVGGHGLPVFAAPNANDLFVMYGGVLNRSTDGGRSWTAIPEPVLDAKGSAGNLQFANAEYGWYDNGSRLYYTPDGGVTWKPVGGR
ncbi:MAG: YCF48-related protein [Conexibacteraceae bacterium]|nr:YCF48-related protein [Conexibacteraceae bacterium]